MEMNQKVQDMVNFFERQVKVSVGNITARLTKKENTLEDYYAYLEKEKEFLSDTQLDTTNWQTQLTSKKGLTQVFSRMIELTLLKHDKRQAFRSDSDDQEKL